MQCVQAGVNERKQLASEKGKLEESCSQLREDKRKLEVRILTVCVRYACVATCLPCPRGDVQAPGSYLAAASQDAQRTPVIAGLDRRVGLT